MFTNRQVAMLGVAVLIGGVWCGATFAAPPKGAGAQARKAPPKQAAGFGVGAPTGAKKNTGPSRGAAGGPPSSGGPTIAGAEDLSGSRIPKGAKVKLPAKSKSR